MCYLFSLWGETLLGGNPVRIEYTISLVDEGFEILDQSPNQIAFLVRNQIRGGQMTFSVKCNLILN